MNSSSVSSVSQQIATPVLGKDASASSTSQYELMPWDTEENWVPRSKNGKQRTPNMIRNELQRYIDECKASKSSTQTEIIAKMGGNSSSFRRFMDPQHYKSPWSATQNSTYWQAAKLLEQVKYELKQTKEANKKSGKRKANTDDLCSGTEAKKAKGDTSDSPATSTSASTDAATVKKTKAQAKLEMVELIQRISAVEGVGQQHPVHDTCPQVALKIKEFIQREGMTKSLLLAALGNVNSSCMNRFLAGKKQDQCGRAVYKEGFLFFEKLRILEGQKKSKARIKNEREHPTGFSLVKKRKEQWFIVARR